MCYSLYISKWRTQYKDMINRIHAYCLVIAGAYTNISIVIFGDSNGKLEDQFKRFGKFMADWISSKPNHNGFIPLYI